MADAATIRYIRGVAILVTRPTGGGAAVRRINLFSRPPPRLGRRGGRLNWGWHCRWRGERHGRRRRNRTRIIRIRNPGRIIRIQNSTKVRPLVRLVRGTGKVIHLLQLLLPYLPCTVEVQLISCFFVRGTGKVARLLRLLTPSTKLAHRPLVVHLLHFPRTVEFQPVCFFVRGTGKVIHLLRLLAPSIKP